MRAAFYFVVGVLIAFLLVPLAARAEDYPAVQTWQYPAGVFFYTGAGWCGAYGADKDNTLGPTAIILGCHMNSPTQACIDWKQGEAGSPQETCANSFPSCPGGGSLSGSMCVGASACPAGQTRNAAGQCAPPVCTAGQVITGTVPATGLPTTTCTGGCEATVIQASDGYIKNGQRVVLGSWSQTGQNCTSGTSVTSGTDGATQCKSGTCPGTFNGQQLCLPCSDTNKTTSVTTSSKTTTNGSGQTTGTSTTTTTTTQDGSGITTTTSTTEKDGAGNTTGGSTEQDRKENDSFCKENPTSPMCKESSWGGSCGAFTCDGDAVVCAIAKEQHKRNCELDTAAQSTGVMADARDALNGVPDPTGNAFRNPQSSSLPSMFNTTDGMAGSCPSPAAFSVLGVSLSFSYQPMCDLAGLLRPMLIAFALLVGARIALGGL